MVPDELTAGPRVAAFAARYCIHTKGQWAGQPVIFEDWQREFIWEAYEVNPETGLRVYQEVGLGLPRKNGKSLVCTVCAHYGLSADGEAEPEVYIGAGARQQAGIVLGQARSMALRSSRLSDLVRVRAHHIENTRNGGVMRALSADGALQHGLNPSTNVIDELHAHKNGNLWTALTTGTGAREQPLTFWITTAGVAGAGILAQIYESMFSGGGQLEDRGSLKIYRDRPNGVLIYWYGAPQDGDIEDPAVWKGANPASWRTVDRLGQDFRKLKDRGETLDWRRYYLNQFVDIEEAWLPVGAWEACRGDFKFDPKLPVGVGIDKGQTSDLSAVVVAQKQGDRVGVALRLFPPLQSTGRVNSAAIRAHLREIRTKYPRPMTRDVTTKRVLPGPAFGFDRWSFGESAELLEDDGLNMVDFPQTAAYMGPASTSAYEMITTGRLVHDGDPVLAQHVHNTSAVMTERGMKVSKPKKVTPNKNDGCVAMVMAVAMAVQEAPKYSMEEPRQAVGF